MVFARASSGEIGCPEDEIQISDFRRGGGVTSWVAECRGRIYRCSKITGEASVQVTCKEDTGTTGGETPVVVTSSERGCAHDMGCAYDMQCKGDRVCEEGRCVYPVSQEATPPTTPHTEASE